MTNNERIYKTTLPIIFFASVIYITAYVLFTDFQKLIFITPDDASYYLKIAENFYKGKGFTFDGLHQTNGFQPLWQYFLIPLASVSVPPETMLRIVFIIQIILLVIAAVILYTAQSEIFSIKHILPGALLFIIFVFFKAVNGMETALLILLISFFYLFCIKLNLAVSSNRMHFFLAGILLGLIILCRLDMIFLAVAIGAFMLFKIFANSNNRNAITGLLIVLITGCTIIVLPYLFYNYVVFENIIPISGYLKSSFPRITMNDKFFFMLGYRELIFVLFALLYLVWFIVRLNVLRKSDTRISLFSIYMGVFSVFVLLYFIYTIIFMNWVIFSWYFVSYSVFASLAISLPVHNFFANKTTSAKNIVYFLFCSMILVYGIFKTYKLYEQSYIAAGNNWNIESYKAAKWAEANTNVNSIFAMKDAGHFSYFSKRNVINLDGLVNNFEYQEVLKERRLNEYLKQNNVKYVVTHAIWDRDDITDGNYDTLHLSIASHKYSGESDPVILRKLDEVYRSKPYYDGPYRAAFIIWKIKD